MRVLFAIALVLAALYGAVQLIGTNLQEVTIHFSDSVSYTTTVMKLAIACVLLGVLVGLLVHLYYSLSFRLQAGRMRKREKRERELNGLYLDGRTRLLSQDLKKARTQLQKALERDPGRHELVMALAELELAEGQLPKAVELWRQVHERNPEEIESLLRMAQAYQAGGHSQDAILALQDVLKIDKENPWALRKLRDLLVAAERWTDALEVQKRLLKLTPVEAADKEKRMQVCLRYELALATLHSGQPDRAGGELKELVKQAPDFAPAVVSLGDALKAQGKLGEAAKRWQQGYLQFEQGVFLARLEDAYLEAEDPTALLTIHRSLLGARPDDQLLRLYFGRICLRLEMIDEALEHLQTVEQAGVHFALLHVLLAEAYRRRDQFKDALAEYQLALGTGGAIGYQCDACGAQFEQWFGRCNACGDWAGFRFSDRDALRGPAYLEAREIHHGEREAGE